MKNTSRASELLEQEHYLGDCPEGRQLLQVVEYQSHWVALLDWGPACWKLADRETHIGWTHQQRAERLGLIVQNRRFLVLGKERMPNLASRALGLALKALPEHWEERHGYRPLMAETFTDIEQFEGTCYKASNWEPLGLTKGFQRHPPPRLLSETRSSQEALDQEPEPQLTTHLNGNRRTQSLPECTQPRHTRTRPGIKENTDGKPAQALSGTL